MDSATRRLIRQRAGHRCEYCNLPDDAIDLPFHVEHIIASVHLVDEAPSNLAWACPRCNLKKGPNLATIDPATGRQASLFNPRAMKWSEHFSVQGAAVIGVTSSGRGSVHLLDMNNENRLLLRQALIAEGKFIVVE